MIMQNDTDTIDLFETINYALWKHRIQVIVQRTVNTGITRECIERIYQQIKPVARSKLLLSTNTNHNGIILNLTIVTIYLSVGLL